MTICFLGAILLILTQKSSQKFGDVLGIMRRLIITIKMNYYYFKALASKHLLFI